MSGLVLTNECLCVEAFFSMAISTDIGDGTHYLFWKD
jgi:hypothetical protein